MIKTNSKKVKQIYMLFFLALLTIPMVSQKNESNDLKNQISLGYCLNVPSGNFVDTYYAETGANFSISYTRSIWKTFVISAKYVSLTNAEEVNRDLIDLTVNSSNAGTWTGTSTNYKTSAFLIGLGQKFETGKKKKSIFAYKLFLGNGSFSMPDFNFRSSLGINVKQPSTSSNALIYDFSFLGGYKISKNISIFIEGDLYKSNVNVTATSTGTYQSNTSSQKNDYNISYNNTSMTLGLSYCF